MKNDYEIRGETTAIFIDRRDGSRLECLIDTEDLDYVDVFPNKWCLNGNGYINGFYPNSRGNRVEWILHRYVINAPSDLLVDHKNLCRNDNRKENLRIVNKSENAQNRNANSNSSTGVRGVYKYYNKYKAKIFVNGEQMYLGLYDTIEEAEQVVKEARKKYMPFSQE